MKQLSRKGIAAEFYRKKIMIGGESLRFIIVGLVNTFHYYVLYLLCTEIVLLHYLVSHWLAFFISMIGSFFLNTYFTYRTRPSWRKLFQFPLTYVVNIFVSSSALFFLKEWLLIENWLAPLIATVLAIPFTFLLSRKILKT